MKNDMLVWVRVGEMEVRSGYGFTPGWIKDYLISVKSVSDISLRSRRSFSPKEYMDTASSRSLSQLSSSLFHPRLKFRQIYGFKSLCVTVLRNHYQSVPQIA